MEHKNPKAELMSWTVNPVETLYVIWMQSKDPTFGKGVDEITRECKHNMKLRAEVLDIFRKIISQKIPVSENINFTFMLYNVPISLREQMVRHRIGVKFGDNFGVDIAPEVQSSSWWSQSMRILNFNNMMDDERFFVPETIRQNKESETIYLHTLQEIQEGYKKLVESGIPMEDARNLLPLGATMDISWTLNLASFSHIIGKRSCWILQYGLWNYMIKDMIKELTGKIDTIFRDIVLPPCFEKGNFKNCVFQHENERRKDGEDALPVCPLYYTHHMSEEEQYSYTNTFPEMDKKQKELAPKYGELWGKHPWLG